MHPRAAELIHTLQLAPHPEGGFYRETFLRDDPLAVDSLRSAAADLTALL